MSLSDSIPNNVDLGSDRKLLRALEKWQPNFREWWLEMGPEGFQEDEIYLRTATSVDKSGWATYDYVKMPDYRWGIFLTPRSGDRFVNFGDNQGDKVWQEVPGELRGILRRIIVTQADTEPASVEQQRLLGKSAPSLYDLRNLFQVNVEEGRHLWAMVHLLQQYFGRDGREEADALLARRSGDEDKPRILQTFNESISDWMSFFMFTMFTDRDGSISSLLSVSPASTRWHAPLSSCSPRRASTSSPAKRVSTASFAAGLSSPSRIPTGMLAPRAASTCRRFRNGSTSGSRAPWSCSAARSAPTRPDFFATGLKGRYRENKKYEDHQALGEVYTMPVPKDGRIEQQEVPLRNALNEVLRDEYVQDCARAVRRWNRTIADEGVSFELRLPSRRFNRSMGLYAGLNFDLEGRPMTEEAFRANAAEWLPTPEDRAYVTSLMKAVYEPGKMAHWIAPPKKGVGGQDLEFEYVKRTSV